MSTSEQTDRVAVITAIAADDIAELIAFVLSRPRRVARNEILVRPAAQA